MRRNLALALVTLAAAELVVAVWSAVAAGLTWAQVVDSYVLTNGAMGAGFAFCGGILAAQRTRNPIGWLLIAAGLAHLTSAALSGVIGYGVLHGWPESLLSLMLSVFNLAWPWGITLLLPLALQLFPDGKLVSKGWRWPFAATVVFGVGFVLAMGGGPEPLAVHGRTVEPMFVLPGYDSLDPLWFLANMASIVGLVTALAGLVVRYRRGDDQLRRQLLWLRARADRRRRPQPSRGGSSATARSCCCSRCRWCRSRSPSRSCATGCSTSGWSSRGRCSTSCSASRSWSRTPA